MASRLDATLFLIVAAAGALSAGTLRAQRAAASDPAPIWTGVYTAAQADRGKAVYEHRCSRCHAEDLNGVGAAPLAGQRFMDTWEGRTIERLFRRIRDTMPPDAAAIVDDDDKRDVVAYVLRENGFPDGPSELATNPDVLGAIPIASRNGPAPVRSGAVVQVIGCLRPDGDRGWLLTDSTEPRRTSLEAVSGVDPRADAVAASGSPTVHLLNVFPNPAPHRDRLVRVKGFLVRGSGDDRVNVVSLELVAPACAR